jgi:predicted flap endonuclease-1-like 5' DNA nuclease
MPAIIDVEGIGPKYAEKLKGAGIKTTDKLLKVGASPKGRKELGEKTGIGHELILDWVNHVDLFRIKGVGSEYADLLEKAGVDTVVELAKRVPQNLVDAMAEVNKKHKVVRRLPVLKEVVKWVDQAKKLPRAVEY